MSLSWRSDQKYISKMAQHMLASGSAISNTATEYKYGRMALSMKEIGDLIRLVAMASSGTSMEMSLKASG